MVADDAPVVLFVWVHNAGRSQMAAALLERHAGDGVEVVSAGSEPADALNPVVVDAMREIGIDLDGRVPRLLATDEVRTADVVVTMGCGDACPIFPGKRYEDWELEDPAGKDLATVRRIRDEIDTRVRALAAELPVRARDAAEGRAVRTELRRTDGSAWFVLLGVDGEARAAALDLMFTADGDALLRRVDGRSPRLGAIYAHFARVAATGRPHDGEARPRPP